MDDSKNIPRHKLLDFAFEQYETLGLDFMFPLNPSFNELCERAELAGYAPLVILAPKDEALRALDERTKRITFDLTGRS